MPASTVDGCVRVDEQVVEITWRKWCGACHLICDASVNRDVRPLVIASSSSSSGERRRTRASFCSEHHFEWLVKWLHIRLRSLVEFKLYGLQAGNIGSIVMLSVLLARVYYRLEQCLPVN